MMTSINWALASDFMCVSRSKSVMIRLSSKAAYWSGGSIRDFYAGLPESLSNFIHGGANRAFKAVMIDYAKKEGIENTYRGD